MQTIERKVPKTNVIRLIPICPLGHLCIWGKYVIFEKAVATYVVTVSSFLYFLFCPLRMNSIEVIIELNIVISCRAHTRKGDAYGSTD